MFLLLAIHSEYICSELKFESIHDIDSLFDVLAVSISLKNLKLAEIDNTRTKRKK